ncbi:hypothetical protein [Streptomyces albidoflavus]|uniref:hypothetical protein n=1 Tax=Streptomyces albidoflavus TaxID=1886 RepID=UPI0033C35027
MTLPPAEDPSIAAGFHPAVRRAEEAADACWQLAETATGDHPGSPDHDVAGRLLGAVDALGVVLRTTAHRLRESDSSPDGAAGRWQAADHALAVVFAELYDSMPADEPARHWFTRYDET